MSNFAIVLAAGSGTRMENHQRPKCFISVGHKNLYSYSVNKFALNDNIKMIILTVPNDCYLSTLNHYRADQKVKVVIGGKTRQESVFKALSYLKDYANDDDNILIHDAARPLVSDRIINDNIAACEKYGACVTAIKSIDTILISADDGNVADIPNRSKAYQEQTPATFKFSLIYQAHLKAIENSIDDISDDCSLVLSQKHQLYIVNGDRNNFKVTNEIDLSILKQIVNQKN